MGPCVRRGGLLAPWRPRFRRGGPRLLLLTGRILVLRTVGGLLGKRLSALMQRYEIIGDVRGMGMLQAFELVADRATMAPLPKALNAYDRLAEIAYDNGLIIYARRSRGGHDGDHFLVAPPMITTEAQVDEIIDKLTRSLDRFVEEAGL